jgi:hypothetical protein
MTERQLKYLYDIQLAILEIEDFQKLKGPSAQIRVFTNPQNDRWL